MSTCLASREDLGDAATMAEDWLEPSPSMESSETTGENFGGRPSHWRTEDNGQRTGETCTTVPFLTCMEAFRPALQRLDALLQLPADWDSRGAVRISSAAATRVRELFLQVQDEAARAFPVDPGEQQQHTDETLSRLEPMVFPLDDGSLQVEWYGPHSELELEVEASNWVSGLLVIRSSSANRYVELPPMSLNEAALQVIGLL